MTSKSKWFAALALAGAAAAALAPLGAAAGEAVANPDMAARGRALYGEKCARCHGFNMVNPGTISYDLRKFPEDERERFNTSVLGGKGNMPAWKSILNEDDLNALWAYVLTRGKTSQ